MKYYLKQNVQIKPLYNNWQVHSYLLYPPTAALYCKNSHITTMESFLQMPLAHKLALQSDEIKGGQYIDYDDEFIPEIQKLCDDTKVKSSALIDLANSIELLRDVLKEKADNRPMEEIYDDVPEKLKGYVELVYDNLHQPNARYYEDLFFHNEEFNNTNSQSIAISLKTSDDDKGFSSSPILEDKDTFIFQVPFSDERIDQIFSLKDQARTIDEIKSIFGRNEFSEEFMNLLTTEKAKSGYTPSEENLRIRFFGHAGLLIESKHSTVLVDPVIAYDIETSDERFTYSDLPEKIDYVVISHRHHDHISIETLLHLRKKIDKIIVPKGSKGSLLDPSLKLILGSIGFKNVIELETFDEVDLIDGKITGIPFMGEHSDIDIQAKICYHIKLAEKSMITFVDCDVLEKETFRLVKNKVGPIDIIFIGLESHGAPLSWQTGTMMTALPRKFDEVRRGKGSDENDAIFLFETFEAKKIYLYAMALEPWIAPILAINKDHSAIIHKNIEVITDFINKKHPDALELLSGKKEITF